MSLICIVQVQIICTSSIHVPYHSGTKLWCFFSIIILWKIVLLHSRSICSFPIYNYLNTFNRLFSGCVDLIYSLGWQRIFFRRNIMAISRISSNLSIHTNNGKFGYLLISILPNLSGLTQTNTENSLIGSSKPSIWDTLEIGIFSISIPMNTSAMWGNNYFDNNTVDLFNVPYKLSTLNNLGPTYRSSSLSPGTTIRSIWIVWPNDSN